MRRLFRKMLLHYFAGQVLGSIYCEWHDKGKDHFIFSECYRVAKKMIEEGKNHAV